MTNFVSSKTLLRTEPSPRPSLLLADAAVSDALAVRTPAPANNSCDAAARTLQSRDLAVPGMQRRSSD